ncbi:hypothetical protein DICSQDRAFT_166003 [Dichomitus squalens LYAD-421 SS1]|uniref:uncharacterized protein n=1 Tax=Dichomitus squalens (strain LYAD-421) TaxID=732165 RepID=UPI0004412AF6|nr:uncharacterized protein DICSQDRAFT_166003 [Dichomitus squalens LYAD-421 SS1]EJF66304.1 hypothetical protein DICSQDRAFT_166003 [Dichomitus squalens LYAD-421 SS1]
MTFLPLTDLSALMRTCRLLSEVGFQPLCARSGEPLRTPTQILSFLEFLHIGAPHSPAPVIKDLRLSLEEHRVPQRKASYFEHHTREPAYFTTSSDPLQEEYLLRAYRNQALEAFRMILQKCCNLRRLNIGRWYEDVPIAPLTHVISSLTALEELRMPMVPRSQLCNDVRLASLPLRKLVLRPGRWHELPDALNLLQPLSSTLVELDIPVCRWKRPDAPFPHVRKLAIEFPASGDVVLDLVHAFPNLTHLSLGGTRNFHLCHTLSSRAEEDRLREHSQGQWRLLTYSWPSLVAVHTESPCVLYTLALPFKVPRVSIGYSAGDPAENMLPKILADTSPTCLEMRIKQVHFKYFPLPRRFTGLKPGDATASLQRFILTMEGTAVPDYVMVTSMLIDELKEALVGLPVTHLLLKFSLDHFFASRAHTRSVVRTICADAPRRVAAIARAAPSLRWIGVHVHVCGGPTWLYCWTVSREQPVVSDFDFNAAARVTLEEISEDDGWEMLAAEEMEDVAGL